MPTEIEISKSQSITSTINRNAEIFSLTPSTLVTLWEIDASTLIDETGLREYNPTAIFYFHNSIKLTQNSIKWRDNTYIAIPIHAEGFEYSAKGSPATPKLSLTVNEHGIETLALLKSTLKRLGDLAGVKVTRRRVFAKYIDKENFPTLAPSELAEKGFAPDPNMQFDPDIYYIDRKSMENKSIIEFELGSIIDIDGVKLPGRICSAKRCPFAYRGAFCNYETEENRVEFIHGTDSTLLKSAPPVSNDKGELIQTILGRGTTIKVIGEHKFGTNYAKGNAVWIQKDGIKYYFVALQNSPPAGPPNPLFWVADSCSKDINGCRQRYKNAAALPFGGFVGITTTI